MLAPAADAELYMAMARVRAAPSVKVVVSSASVAGAAIAAPTPWSARAPSSQPSDCASPPSNDVAVKSPRPAMNTRRRPSRSPARAPSSSRPPNVSVYAFWTQDSPVGEKPRSVWISGSAVMTIEASRTIISWQVRTIASTKAEELERWSLCM